MHAFLPAEGCAEFLADELTRSGAQVQPLGHHDFVIADALPEPPLLAFARQTLPDAREVIGASINGWADAIIEAMLTTLGDDDPWQLHLWPQYGEGRAGHHRRCDAGVRACAR